MWPANALLEQTPVRSDAFQAINMPFELEKQALFLSQVIGRRQIFFSNISHIPQDVRYKASVQVDLWVHREEGEVLSPEPWMIFLPTSIPKSPLMVPCPDASGLVAPIRLRPVFITSFPSQTMATCKCIVSLCFCERKKSKVSLIQYVLLQYIVDKDCILKLRAQWQWKELWKFCAFPFGILPYCGVVDHRTLRAFNTWFENIS